jgi:hypothetical protein
MERLLEHPRHLITEIGDYTRSTGESTPSDDFAETTGYTAGR